MSQILVVTGWSGIVEPTLKLAEEALRRWLAEGKKLPDPLQIGPQEEAIWFARVLGEVPAAHFTPEQRARYFTWFGKATEFKGGNSFGKFLEAIRDRALAKLDAAEKEKMLAVIAAATPAPAQAATAEAPARQFVKNWTLAEIEPHLGALKAGRNFARGKEVYTSMLCAKCHRFGPGFAEGNVGPDLTAVGGRFAAKDILEAMTDPSKAISEQYASFVFTKKDGGSMSGQIAEESADAFTLYGDPFGLSKLPPLPKAEVVRREVAAVSLMPAGLLNNLQLDEILDLTAFLQTGGDEQAEAFRPTP